MAPDHRANQGRADFACGPKVVFDGEAKSPQELAAGVRLAAESRPDGRHEPTEEIVPRGRQSSAQADKRGHRRSNARQSYSRVGAETWLACACQRARRSAKCECGLPKGLTLLRHRPSRIPQCVQPQVKLFSGLDLCKPGRARVADICESDDRRQGARKASEGAVQIHGHGDTLAIHPDQALGKPRGASCRQSPGPEVRRAPEDHRVGVDAPGRPGQGNEPSALTHLEVHR